MVQGYPELNNRGVHRIGLEVYDPTIDDSSYRWNFILDKKNKINLVPRVFRKDPGIGWSRASSKIDCPRGCGESIKLQTVKNINFANYYQY